MHDAPGQSIVHVDGDAFFAYCEVAQNERLRGKPVVTGQEKGMAIAVSYEAKALGISRGMLIRDIRKLVPQAIILPGRYDLYKIIARRMYHIVRRHAPVVEEYSIDECFADISSCGDNWEDLVAIAHSIKNDLEHDLGMTFSLGLASTKTLAKVASKWKKPAGFTAMQKGDTDQFLKDVPIGAVWGIGSSMSAQLKSKGVHTALEFSKKPLEWIAEHFSKPVQEIWYELNNIPMHSVKEGSHEKHKSIRATRTFRPPSKNPSFILSQLSKNAEHACLKLRTHGLQTKAVYFYLKTQSFRYRGYELRFDIPTSSPSHILGEIKKYFLRVYDPSHEYRASGIVLNSISPQKVNQLDLFGYTEPLQEAQDLYKNLDTLERKFGRNAVFLTSSLQARKMYSRKPETLEESFTEIGFRLGIPSWGESL